MSKKVNTKEELLNPKPGMIGKWKEDGLRKLYTRKVIKVEDCYVYFKTSTAYDIRVSLRAWQEDIKSTDCRNK